MEKLYSTLKKSNRGEGNVGDEESDDDIIAEIVDKE